MASTIREADGPALPTRPAISSDRLLFREEPSAFETVQQIVFFSGIT